METENNKNLLLCQELVRGNYEYLRLSYPSLIEDIINVFVNFLCDKEIDLLQRRLVANSFINHNEKYVIDLVSNKLPADFKSIFKAIEFEELYQNSLEIVANNSLMMASCLSDDIIHPEARDLYNLVIAKRDFLKKDLKVKHENKSKVKFNIKILLNKLKINIKKLKGLKR